METEKEPRPTGKKRAYHSPQVTPFGPVANVTQVNFNAEANDNPSSMDMTQGDMIIS
ncbi:MAG: hypothetical protein V7754_20120 [Halioglobus sp.]